MERNIKSLINYNIAATDGIIGEVEEFYFNDKSWKIRYLIVKTGDWLSERKVLIAPHALMKQPWHDGLFPVNLTKKQIENSPDIDTDKPVSRQQEIELYGHYQWESYWGSGFYGGGSLGGSMPFPVLDRKVLIEADKDDKRSDDDVHLRSTGTITGYHIHATDGEVGHINDFIIDDQSWKITSIVIDTHNWFGGKKVLVPVEHVNKINWSENKIFLNITTAAIEKSMLFNVDDYLHVQRMNNER
jgi:sporulation protein YlmC with PRC-barrel domain